MILFMSRKKLGDIIQHAIVEERVKSRLGDVGALLSPQMVGDAEIEVTWDSVEDNRFSGATIRFGHAHRSFPAGTCCFERTTLRDLLATIIKGMEDVGLVFTHERGTPDFTGFRRLEPEAQATKRRVK